MEHVENRIALNPALDALRGGKFLAAANIKRSFSFSFESMLFELMGKNDPALAESGTDRKSAKRPEEKSNTKESRSREKTEENGRKDESIVAKPEATASAPADETPARTDGPAPEEGTETAAAGGDKPKESERPAEAKGKDSTKRDDETGRTAKPEKGEVENGKVSVKVVHIEASMRLSKALSDEELAALKRKVGKLIEKEKGDPAELAAGMLDLLKGLGLNENEALEAFDAEDGSDLARRRKLMKRFLDYLKSILDNAGSGEEKRTSSQETAADNRPVSEDSGVRKIVRKIIEHMERRSNENLSEFKIDETSRDRSLDRLADEGGKKDGEKDRVSRTRARAERPVIETGKTEGDGAEKAEKPRLVETRRVVAETAPVHRKISHGERIAVDLKGSVEVGGIRNSARSENGSNQFWQQQYDQNSSSKGMFDKAAHKAAKAPAKPFTMNNPIFDQIVRKAHLVLKEGSSEATIRLKPEFLGNVELKVKVEDGHVAVKMHAEHAAVRGILADNLESLRRTLVEMGLSVDLMEVASGNVDVSTGQGGETDDEEYGTRKGTGTTGFADEDGIDEIEAAEAAAKALRDEVIRGNSSREYVA